MTSQELAVLIAQANQIGKAGGLTCRYEWCGIKRRFLFHYFRHGRFICSSSDEKRVLAKMQKLVTAN